MLVFGMLRRLLLLLLAGTCLCVCGTPVRLSSTALGSANAPADVKSGASEAEHVMLDVGVGGGGAGPHGRPEGTAQTENGDRLDGRSGPSEAGGEAQSQSGEEKKVGSTSEMGDDERWSEAASLQPVDPKADAPVTGEPASGPTGGRKQWDVAQSATHWAEDGFRGFLTTMLPKRSISARDQGDSLMDLETSVSSSTRAPNPREGIQSLTSDSPAPLALFASPLTSTSLSVWGHDGATPSSLPDPLLPEIGPNLMPREDGPESVWTEAARPGGGKSEQHHNMTHAASLWGQMSRNPFY